MKHIVIQIAAQVGDECPHLCSTPRLFDDRPAAIEHAACVAYERRGFTAADEVRADGAFSDNGWTIVVHSVDDA